MTAPHRYRAFGLAFASDFELPELVRDEQPAPPDVTIRRVETGRRFPEPDAPGEFRFGDEECFLLYPQVGAFRLVGDGLIEVEPVPGVDPGLIAFPLLGPLMGLLMRARGTLVLHGSALEVGGEGVGFLGDKGAGKSTTAGACIRAGHGLLTDDILVIAEPGTPAARILPAFPQVKLAGSASEALALAAARQRRPVPIVNDKERYALASGFVERPVAPSRFYLLKRGGEAAILPLATKVRMKALLRFSYVSRFGPRAMTRAAAARHVRHCASLAEQVRIAILTVPDDLSSLDAIPDLIAEDTMRSEHAA
jgi:hypothetical protein